MMGDFKALGVIIAGGKSRRFNRLSQRPSAPPEQLDSCPQTRVDKFLMPFGSSSLLGHIIDRAQKQVDSLILNINGDPRRLQSCGQAKDLKVIADDIRDVGPLGGILTAMNAATKNGYSHIITFSGDSPFFPDDYVVRLTGAVRTTEARIAICKSRGADGEIHRHPTMGIYAAELQDDLATYIHDGGRRVMEWVGRQPYKDLIWDNMRPDPFFNINRREDLMAAEKLRP